jgi:uncharacterized protein YceH (UPF0502 family)
LGAPEVRVLGSLVEKDITTPDYYPLTLNSLTNACSQINNRDPVVALGEAEVLRALGALREARLAFVFEGAESRVSKFGHRLTEALELERPEVSVLCVLLLRGPQTVGEIRGRTARMHAFASLGDAEASLERLCARIPPLVAKLPRQSGMKEQRYAHLLSGPAAAEAAERAPAPAAPDADRLGRVEAETAALRVEVAELRKALEDLRAQLG